VPFSSYSREVPLPDWLARFNRGATNRLTRTFAGSVRGFGVLTHVGRVSGRPYQTPVNVFRSGDRYVIALTYGRERDWVKNVMAAGYCELESGGVARHLVEPRIVTDPGRSLVPSAIRPILKVAGVSEFMVLSVA
jgi:deazaflavin-dependent oxidoreductase (nitroreductase family)